MTKDELIGEIQKYVVPVQASLLKTYSQERLEDYLGHLRAMGCRRKGQELATASVGHAGSRAR